MKNTSNEKIYANSKVTEMQKKLIHNLLPKLAY